MDELTLTISTKFMRKVVAKLIARHVYKKYGYKIDIRFENLDVGFINGDTTIKTNVELRMGSDDFKKIILSSQGLFLFIFAKQTTCIMRGTQLFIRRRL